MKLGLYIPGLVRTFGYYVLSVDHGHRQSAFFALSLFWIKRTLFRTYLFSFPLRVRNNQVSLYCTSRIFRVHFNFVFFRTWRLPYENKMRTKGSKQVRERAAVRGCKKISCTVKPVFKRPPHVARKSGRYRQVVSKARFPRNRPIFRSSVEQLRTLWYARVWSTQWQ